MTHAEMQNIREHFLIILLLNVKEMNWVTNRIARRGLAKLLTLSDQWI